MFIIWNEESKQRNICKKGIVGEISKGDKIKKFFNHFKTQVLRGLLAIIPLALTALAVQFIYVVIDKRAMALVDQFIGFRIPGLGIIFVIIILYVVGAITSNVVGKKFFNILEGISNRIPLVKTTYQVGKQLANTFSLSGSQVFKQVVLLDFFKPGAWMIGFVSGSIWDKKTNEKLLKIFIPTVPNPTSGYLVMLKESQVKNTAWSVEEGMRLVISGGIIGPEHIA